MQSYNLFYNNAAILIKKTEKCSQEQANNLIYSNNLDFNLLLKQLLEHQTACTINCQNEQEQKVAFERITSLLTLQKAAGGLVLKEDDLLLIYRSGKWDLPKGHVETDETEEQTALREVEEETGVKNLTLTQDLGFTFHIFFDEKYTKKYILKQTHWFEMKAEGINTLIPQIQEQITQVVWQNRHRLSQFKANTYPSLLELLNRWGLAF